MKLRSGKILNSMETVLPPELDSMLETKLQTFARLFSGNMQHAKELLDIISKSQSIDARFDIREKIEEIYDINKTEEIAPLMRAAGDLAWLLVYTPQYHNLIETRMENFDSEMSLAGGIEELS